MTHPDPNPTTDGYLACRPKEPARKSSGGSSAGHQRDHVAHYRRAGSPRFFYRARWPSEIPNDPAGMTTGARRGSALVSEVRLERRPHPKNRRDMMKALTLPEQDVLMRIVVSIDNFCATRNTTWEAASALLQYLACFGVDAVRSALAAGEKYGAFRMAKYPHPADQDRPPTTGISLNREVPFVARVLERRNTLLRALYAAHERCAGTWEQDIAAITGEKATLWRSILTTSASSVLIRREQRSSLCALARTCRRAACGLLPPMPPRTPRGPSVGLFACAHGGGRGTPARHADGNGRRRQSPPSIEQVGPGVFD